MAYYHLKLSLEKIQNSIEDKKIKGQRIEFLYCVAYLKIYLSYLVQYTTDYLEELGDAQSIINILVSFGGEDHSSFKKSMYYYIIKLFDSYSGVYSKLSEISWAANQFDPIVQKIELINDDAETISELDFPFYRETDVYLNIYNNYNDNDLKENTYEDFKQLYGNNTIEFVNFLLNIIFVYSLEYSKKKQNENHEFNNKLLLLKGFNKYAFVLKKDFQSCLELLLNCEKESQAQFFKDIQKMSQKDYVKLLFCFKLVVIIANKGDGNYSNIYSYLYKSFNEKIPINFSDKDKLSYVIYLSLRFFGKYLNVLSNNQKK